MKLKRLFLIVPAALVLLTCAAYAAATVFYVLPDNPLRRRGQVFCKTFERYCYQRWTFFAPPPVSNSRLYFTYVEDGGLPPRSFEVLQPIVKNKQRQNPFNTGEEILDYIISGATEQISKYWMMRNQSAGLLQRGNTGGKVVPANLNLAAMHTLRNYARIIAHDNGLKLEGLTVVMEARSVAIANPELVWKGLRQPPAEHLKWKSASIAL